MFSGLVQAVGRVATVERGHEKLELEIDSPFEDLAAGESVAVNGACLTVTRLRGGTFRVQVVSSSLDRTCFAEYEPGRRVNLERALRLGDRLGGHMVQGHVDGIGTIVSVRDQQDALIWDIATPRAVSEVSIPLGSLTVDGVSLTVNALPGPGIVQVSLIPFTRDHTSLGAMTAGARVHLEADMIGKYVKRLIEGRDAR